MYEHYNLYTYCYIFLLAGRNIIKGLSFMIIILLFPGKTRKMRERKKMSILYAFFYTSLFICFFADVDESNQNEWNFFCSPA